MFQYRTVHARYPGMEIVRYDRAGKWWLEPTNSPRRQRVTVAEAAAQARWARDIGDGEVFFGRSGGATFDRLVGVRGER